MREKWMALVAASFLLIAGPVLANSQVLLADGRTLERVDVKPGSGPNEIVVEPAVGDPVRVSPQDLLVVDFGKTPGRELPPMVRMANGDQVYGKVSFPSAKTVKIAAGWGSVSVPLRWCAAIRLNEKAPLPGTVTKDTLVLNNDRVEGDIEGVTGNKVTINLGGKRLAVDLARVQALALTSRPRGETQGGLLLAIDLGGGERLSGHWVNLTPDVLTVKLEWGENLDIPLGSISRLEVKNGKLVYLSALRPTEVKHTPYLDGAQPPYRIDRTVSGRPIRLGGKVYSRGLGAPSRSDLTYTLEAGYQSFAAMIGIDDSVGSAGSVVFRVFGDDRMLFESPVLRGGDAPAEVKLNLKGVLLLRLEVDYGDNGDAADHADWADARLLRQ